ncbi:MAG: M48 family metalloprotease, partial [Burkholderiaceae bacterium]
MEFFERQARARASSRRLVLLFALAVALVLLAVNLAGEAIWKLSTAGAPLPPYFVLTNSFVVLLFVVGGAWLESLRLADGGAAVAHRLGARSLDEYDLRHRRLANVVDEMAIAAGIAVPEVFVLDDPTINALTAGDEPTRCAIIVTRGAVERLDRAELQGVVAHEIAHVVHGDVALNTRAAGALYGLMSLSVMGHGMIGAALPRRDFLRGRGRPGGIPWPGLWLAGVALIGIGWIGHLAGRLIQAGLSRQRELLADARAVELTRDPQGLGRALRKVAGQRGRRLESEYADVVAHLLLAGQSRRHGWLDSHPALALRIRRLYGRYMPSIESVVEARVAVTPSPIAALAPLEFPSGDSCLVPIVVPLDEPVGSGIGAALSVEALVGASMSAVDHAGVLLSAVRGLSPSFEQASRLLGGLVATPVGDPAEAPDEADAADVPAARRADDPLAAALAWVARPEALWLRLPLLEVLTARLRPWPRELHERLLDACRAAIEADGRIDKTEWVYFTLVRHRLLPVEPGREPGPDELRRALAELFG